jgi:hypothetical protein
MKMKLGFPFLEGDKEREKPFWVFIVIIITTLITLGCKGIENTASMGAKHRVCVHVYGLGNTVEIWIAWSFFQKCQFASFLLSRHKICPVHHTLLENI